MFRRMFGCGVGVNVIYQSGGLYFVQERKVFFILREQQVEDFSREIIKKFIKIFFKDRGLFVKFRGFNDSL